MKRWFIRFLLFNAAVLAGALLRWHGGEGLRWEADETHRRAVDLLPESRKPSRFGGGVRDALTGRPSDQAKLALVMMRCAEVDPAGAAAWGERRALSGNVGTGLAPFTAWARLDPEAAGDAMRESPSRWIAQCGPRVLAG